MGQYTMFIIILLHRQQGHALAVRINRSEILHQRLLVRLWILRSGRLWHLGRIRRLGLVEEVFHVRVAGRGRTTRAILLDVVEEVPDPNRFVDMFSYSTLY